jgi:hypothetical protein
MSVNEELHEHAEHAHDPVSRRTGAGMAIIAACLAVVAVSGHIETTEELLAQQKASDQWAYYQAKSLRRYQSDVARDILAQMPVEKAGQAVEKYTANLEKYIKEGEEIKKKAEELEAESALSGRRALRLHFGEVFLELAIVFCSLAILSKRSMFFYVAISGAAVGLLVAAGSLLVAH